MKYTKEQDSLNMQLHHFQDYHQQLNQFIQQISKENISDKKTAHWKNTKVAEPLQKSISIQPEIVSAGVSANIANNIEENSQISPHKYSPH